MLVSMTIEVATDADIFNALVEQVLRPKLEPVDVVVPDNLGAHKTASATGKIAACGGGADPSAAVLPDLNSIENVWSKFKQSPRSAPQNLRS